MKKKTEIDINKELDYFADLAYLSRLEENNPAKFAEILLDKSLTEEKLAKIVAEDKATENYPITIEELLTALDDGYVTELSSWDWEGKIYTSPSEYFLLKILDNEFCAIKTQSSKWEILMLKELRKIKK